MYKFKLKWKSSLIFVFVLGKNVMHPFSKDTLPAVSESLWVNLTSSCLNGNWIWGGTWYWTRWWTGSLWQLMLHSRFFGWRLNSCIKKKMQLHKKQNTVMYYLITHGQNKAHLLTHNHSKIIMTGKNIQCSFHSISWGNTEMVMFDLFRQFVRVSYSWQTLTDLQLFKPFNEIKWSIALWGILALSNCKRENNSQIKTIFPMLYKISLLKRIKNKSRIE